MSKACHAQALNNGGRLVAQLHEFRGGIERAPSAVPAAPLARRSIGRRIGRVAIFACSASLRHITAALTARAPHMMRTLVRASLQPNTVQSRASAHLCRAGRLLHSFSAARGVGGCFARVWWRVRGASVSRFRSCRARCSCFENEHSSSEEKQRDSSCACEPSRTHACTHLLCRHSTFLHCNAIYI